MTSQVSDQVVDEEVISVSGKRIAFYDFVKVKPSAPGKKNGYFGKVKGWWIDEGTVVAIDVWGGKPQHERMRSVRPEQIEVLTKKKQDELQRAANKTEVDE